MWYLSFKYLAAYFRFAKRLNSIETVAYLEMYLNLLEIRFPRSAQKKCIFLSPLPLSYSLLLSRLLSFSFIKHSLLFLTLRLLSTRHVDDETYLRFSKAI